MGLFSRRKDVVKRDTSPLSLDQWLSYFTFGGNGYVLPFQQTLQGNREPPISGDFAGLTTGAYKSNGVIFACMLVRFLLFSEARFQFRQLRSGRPGNLFGTAELDVLDHPWPGGTTGDLLTRAIVDVDLAGNFFVARRGTRLRRLRPDWVDIILTGDQGDIDVEALGYVYYPGGRTSGRDPELLDRSEVAHFAPIPDPLAHFRGMSWLTPVMREIMADSATTSHRQKFFENGATVNLVVKMDATVGKTAFDEWVKAFEDRHEGFENAYKTLFLGGGADVTPVGSNFKDMDFKVTQGAGETRIAAAAGVPPVIVGLSEGLQAATYSNYSQARRRFADGTMRPLWRNMAGSLGSIINIPARAELWYDDRDIPFLQEDKKDAADIQQTRATTIDALIKAGYKADAVVDAVMSEDMTRLVGQHTGLFSVQLQAPGSTKMPAGEAPGETPVANGDKPVADKPVPVDVKAGRALAELIEPHLPSSNGS